MNVEPSAPELTLVEAVNLALGRALAEDADVVVFGEDVAVNGGVFRATDGLHSRFGEHRVMDTPLSEGLFTGLAIGLGSQGMRPVARQRKFSLTVSHAATSSVFLIFDQ